MSFQLYTTEAIDEVEARSMNTVSIEEGVISELGGWTAIFESRMEKLVERMREGRALL